ncbi:hypothetical protein [Paraburkholderia sp. JHI869]|uniref:hypothetical protein n=1 Tax=Paraburkholderia sp. JHI869 TaxID=3112959 RepID=UPI003173F0E1
MGTALDGIRQAAKGRPGAKFTTLMQHIYGVDRLRAAYFALERKAAAGVDGQTWQSYGLDLEARLLDLADRLARGAYRPQPVRRVYIDKADGSKRPRGVPALGDKLVQLATVEVLNAIYEQDFVGFSSSLSCVRYRRRARCGRSCQDGSRNLRLVVVHSDAPVCYLRVSDEHEPMRKLKDIDGLFNGRHFDREVIAFCVRWGPRTGKELVDAVAAGGRWPWHRLSGSPHLLHPSARLEEMRHTTPRWPGSVGRVVLACSASDLRPYAYLLHRLTGWPPREPAAI